MTMAALTTRENMKDRIGQACEITIEQLIKVRQARSAKIATIPTTRR